jgi:hypothetical protein
MLTSPERLILLQLDLPRYGMEALTHDLVVQERQLDLHLLLHRVSHTLPSTHE